MQGLKYARYMMFTVLLQSNSRRPVCYTKRTKSNKHAMSAEHEGYVSLLDNGLQVYVASYRRGLMVHGKVL